MEATGSRPVCDTGQFDRVHGHMARAEAESEVFDFGLFKVTFFGFEEEVIVMETFQDKVDKTTMLLQSGGGNKDVIHIDEYLAHVNEVFEHLIHHGLECGWQVG